MDNKTVIYTRASLRAILQQGVYSCVRRARPRARLWRFASAAQVSRLGPTALSSVHTSRQPDANGRAVSQPARADLDVCPAQHKNPTGVALHIHVKARGALYSFTFPWVGLGRSPGPVHRPPPPSHRQTLAPDPGFLFRRVAPIGQTCNWHGRRRGSQTMERAPGAARGVAVGARGANWRQIAPTSRQRPPRR